jgi:hypothetical protein
VADRGAGDPGGVEALPREEQELIGTARPQGLARGLAQAGHAAAEPAREPGLDRVVVRPALAQPGGGRRGRLGAQRVGRGGEHRDAQRLRQQDHAAVDVDEAGVPEAGQRRANPSGPVRGAR